MEKQLNKKEYKDLLEDVCSENCEPNHYCILKEFLISSHPSPRLIMQLKCIDKYKYEQSKKCEKDIGWDGAIAKWVEDGMAERFAKFYDEKSKLIHLYKKIMDRSIGQK